MQGSIWTGLIKRIPEKHHEILVVMTTSGAEIMVQKIINLDDDVLIFRGRPTGSTEHARTILLPFDQVNYIAFAKPVIEKDVRAMFVPSETESGVAAAPGETQPDVSDAAPEPEKDEPQPEASAEAPVQDATPLPEPAKAPDAPSSSLRSGPPSKTLLLARLRARLAKENSP